MSQVSKVGFIAETDVSKLVEAVIGKHGYSRHKLIPLLLDIQNELKHLPRKALEIVSNKLSIPISEIISVASFYHQFRLEPVGDYVFQVCFGTACYLRGAGSVYDALNLATGSSKTRITIEKVRCFGCCSLAPVVMVINTRTGDRSIYGRLNPNDARKIVVKFSQMTRDLRESI
ncbi:MAG: NAD(P)H-dependent oxidoreductase subunit E [Desulfurococcaceae archaeon]